MVEARLTPFRRICARSVTSFSKFSPRAPGDEEFIKDYEQMRDRLRELEAENTRLRATVEADAAIRDLLDKIERLEQEKRELLSRYQQAQAVSTQFSARAQEVESEFANLANLFVASNQLHSSMSPRGVTRRIKEVLAQLVGAERYCMYLANADQTELVPIASEGIAGDKLNTLRIDSPPIGDVLRTGQAFVDEEGDPSRGTLEQPSAVVPLSVDEKVVGVIAIFATLSQKRKFDTIDFELSSFWVNMLRLHWSPPAFCPGRAQATGLEISRSPLEYHGRVFLSDRRRLAHDAAAFGLCAGAGQEPAGYRGR